MQQHIKAYREYFKIGEQDITLCEVCSKPANDIHHIYFRRHKTFELDGREYDIDDILNLIALCRNCHEESHRGEFSKEFLIAVHKSKMIIFKARAAEIAKTKGMVL